MLNAETCIFIYIGKKHRTQKPEFLFMLAKTPHTETRVLFILE